MITYKRFYFVLFFCLSFILGFAQDTNSRRKEANELLKQAGNSFLKLDTKKSLDFAQKALIIATKNSDDLIASKAYNLIGLNFEEFSDYQKAIEYYNKGLVLANKVNNDTVKGWLNNNLGNLYCYRKIDFNKGILHYKEGLKYSIQHKDEYEIMFSKLNIGSAYFAVEDFSNGIQYFNDVKDYVDKNGDIESKISLNSNFGLYYNSLNNNKKAEEYYLKAVNYCEQNDIELIKSNASDVYHDISNFYYKIKDFEKAHFYLLKHDELQDKIYNEERLNDVKVGGLQIEHDEINREIDQIKKEKEIQSFEQKVTKETYSKYNFPHTVDYVETKPVVYRVYSQVMPEGCLPLVLYTTSIDLKNVSALAVECKAMHEKIGQLFKGIDKNNKTIIYRPLKNAPTGTDTDNKYVFMMKNK